MTAELKLLDLMILLASAKLERDLDEMDAALNETRRWLATLGG